MQNYLFLEWNRTQRITFKSGVFQLLSDIIITLNNELSNSIYTGRKLNVPKTFRRRPGRLLNFLCTFNVRPVSREIISYSGQFSFSPVQFTKSMNSVCIDQLDLLSSVRTVLDFKNVPRNLMQR